MIQTLASLVVVGVILGLPLAQSDSQPRITIQRAIVVRPVAGPDLISVTYDYSTPQSDPVQIDGFGPAPATGSLSYLTADRTLRIRSRTGAILVETAITDVQLTMSGSRAELETGFVDTAVREEKYAGKELFSLRMMTVLNQQFPEGVQRYEEDGLTLARSTPRLLSSGKLRVKVSVRVSYPHDNKAGTTFKVAYHALERPSHGRWGALESVDARAELVKFLNELVARLSQ